ncbi:TIGR01741 family protein [Staphylococcus aureus]|nr:TIGR01741 family protein [Staphylococcus aureus]
MTFEEKLSQMYNEIANEISGMIPIEWEKVYTMAYIDDEGGEVFYYYTEPGSDELNYYSDIPKDCNVSKDIFKNSWFKVYRMFQNQFQNLRNIFKEEGYEPWTSCEFDFTKEGELKVSFDYIDWINTEFDQLGRQNYYMYKKFGVIPEMEYEMEEVKEIEQYIKEQDEAEQ